MLTPLSICTLATANFVTQILTEQGGEDSYAITSISSTEEFWLHLERSSRPIDCLVLQQNASLPSLLERLRQRDRLLPAVILEGEVEEEADAAYLYHPAEVRLERGQFSHLSAAIARAIGGFLRLVARGSLETTATFALHPPLEQPYPLAAKLRERLGYLGVYYKRNPQAFIRNLSPEEKRQLLASLSKDYREILLEYFEGEDKVNSKIDRFVEQAFFADLSVSQIVEMHMQHIEDFSQQLKLEGRSDEILLDYRLTLIDIMAHLCEMYRRSIPREDILS